MKELAQIADEILSDNLVKEAAITYNNQQTMKTDVGQLLVKVASILKDNPSVDISYADIAKFRKNYDV